MRHRYVPCCVCRAVKSSHQSLVSPLQTASQAAQDQPPTIPRLLCCARQTRDMGPLSGLTPPKQHQILTSCTETPSTTSSPQNTPASLEPTTPSLPPLCPLPPRQSSGTLLAIVVLLNSSQPSIASNPHCQLPAQLPGASFHPPPAYHPPALPRFTHPQTTHPPTHLHYSWPWLRQHPRLWQWPCERHRLRWLPYMHAAPVRPVPYPTLHIKRHSLKK